MGCFTWWNFPKKAWIIILAELALIAFLSGWIYIQYLSDIYFQSYVNSFAPVLVPVLSIVFGICSASIATYLYFGMKKIRTLEEPDIYSRKKAQREKKSMRRTQGTPSPVARTELQAPTSAKLRPLTPVHNNRTHKPLTKEPTDSPPSEPPPTKKANAHE
jgi:hypothetical protein